MIEVKSWPDDLTKWDNTDPPCYLEVFGETTPVLDMTYAEVLPPGSGSMQQTASTPVYEYWWTIGHAGQRRGHHHFFGGDDSLWANLSDEAAHVYLFFPINAGWRVKEVIATVKYLSPVHNQQSLSERAATDWQKLQPLMADASTLASALGPVPVPGAAAVAPILGGAEQAADRKRSIWHRRLRLVCREGHNRGCRKPGRHAGDHVGPSREICSRTWVAD